MHKVSFDYDAQVTLQKPSSCLDRYRLLLSRLVVDEETSFRLLWLRRLRERQLKDAHGPLILADKQPPSVWIKAQG